MASNKVSFFLVLCLCILLAGECIESPIFTGNKCSDPTGMDKDGKCTVMLKVIPVVLV
ncbi:unnamed protein product [Arabidopsis thaliana]|uniref:Uncharacterized protein n=1 Tax=Arabidopsis thaliana TaxID=3702 RepID=A0A5S9WSV2_ARATH|nr:unnamed protein product [Arabidopsis thaliana]